MAQFRKLQQRSVSYRECWGILIVISSILFVLSQLMLTLLNNYQDGAHVKLMCTSHEPDALCNSSEQANRDEVQSQSLQPKESVVHSHEQLSIRDHITHRYSSPSDNGKIQKQMDLLISNLEYAYTDLDEMLNRQNRFPSIEERVKVYMSNWYIPPCDDSARIPYQYSKVAEDGVTLTLKEVSLVQNEGELLTDDEIIQPDRQQRIFQMNSRFEIEDGDEGLDEVHFLDRHEFMSCKHIYCKDTLTYLLPSFDRLLQSNNTGVIVESSPNVPILYQFGDMFETRATVRYTKKESYRKHMRYPKVPVFQKVRTFKSAADIQFETDETSFSCYNKGERRTATKSNGFHFSYPIDTLQMEPIIFKLKTFRHYGKIYTGAVTNADHTTWSEKKNVAIFRGALTGSYTNGMKSKEAKQLTVVERCRILDRCWFTYSHAASKLIDAKLTEPFAPNREIPRIIDQSGEMDDTSKVRISSQVNLYGNPLSMEELLEYKGLIMLEGNDISSGLKWALFSSSIVLMPEPTLTSWSMEEMLQPWVHYVPIHVHRHSNGTTIITDAQEKMQWIIDNDEKAREIVKASTLWIADFILHPDEINDEKLISDEIARRYLSHFVPSQDLVE